MERWRYLRDKSKDLQAKFRAIKTNTTIVSILISVLSLPILLAACTITPTQPWLAFQDEEQLTGRMWAIALLVLVPGIWLPVRYVPKMLEKYWRRHYRQAWSWLKHTNLPVLAVDDALYDKLGATRQHGNLRALPACLKPRNFDEQIELASDFRLALMILTRGATDGDIPGYTRRLRLAVWWASATRTCESAMEFLFHTEIICTVLRNGCVVFFAVFLPIWLPLLGLYVRRQAWQTAMIDFIRGNSSMRVSEVEAPPGI